MKKNLHDTSSDLNLTWWRNESLPSLHGAHKSIQNIEQNKNKGDGGIMLAIRKVAGVGFSW